MSADGGGPIRDRSAAQAPGSGIGSGIGSAVVIVASSSAAAGESLDTTGPEIRLWLQARGGETRDPIVVPDGAAVGAAIRQALETGPRVIITTGGTGVSPSDRTPEETLPLLDLQLPGIAEEIRRRGSAVTPTAVLTRGLAGFAGDTFVVNLPGSPGGVRDGLAVIDEVLVHLLEQHAGIAPATHAPRDRQPSALLPSTLRQAPRE